MDLSNAVLPTIVTVDGHKYVSVMDLKSQISDTIPLIAMHGLVLNDATYCLGMCDGLKNVAQVLDMALANSVE